MNWSTDKQIKQIIQYIWFLWIDDFKCFWINDLNKYNWGFIVMNNSEDNKS